MSILTFNNWGRYYNTHWTCLSHMRVRVHTHTHTHTHNGQIKFWLNQIKEVQSWLAFSYIFTWLGLLNQYFVGLSCHVITLMRRIIFFTNLKGVMFLSGGGCVIEVKKKNKTHWSREQQSLEGEIFLFKIGKTLVTLCIQQVRLKKLVYGFLEKY